MLEYCTYFAANGADVKVKDDDGRMPLHFAAKCANVEAVKLLLSQGTDVHAQAYEGATPLHSAFCGGIIFCGRIPEVCNRQTPRVTWGVC